MIVVSDSTPLISLVKAERLDLLQSLFGEVAVPEAVFQELTSNDSFRNEADLIKNSGFLKVVEVGDRDRVEFLRRVSGLDRGESEAIIYADETKADLLLMDELAGRKVAKNMRLPITGFVGIIITAHKRQLIRESEAEEIFDRIRKAGRHISERLIDDAMSIIRCDK